MRKMLNQKESNYNRLRRAKMDKSMFVKIKTLGIGAFGEVCLTRKVDTYALYAMKTLRKKDVLNRNQVISHTVERFDNKTTLSVSIRIELGHLWGDFL